MPKPSPQERNSLVSPYPSPWGGENFLSALCAFFWQSMFCSLYGMLPKTLCNFLGISRHKFPCPFVIKREKYFRPFRRSSSPGFERPPPITDSERQQICAPYYNLDAIPPSILSFSPFPCTLYKTRKKIKSSPKQRHILGILTNKTIPAKEMFAHPPLVRTLE